LSIPAAVTVSLSELRDLDKQTIFEDAFRLSRGEVPENNSDFQLLQLELTRWLRRGGAYKDRDLLNHLFVYLIIAKLRHVQCDKLFAVLDPHAKQFIEKSVDKLKIYALVPMLLESGELGIEFKRVKNEEVPKDGEDKDNYYIKVACIIALKCKGITEEHYYELDEEMRAFVDGCPKRFEAEYEDFASYIGTNQDQPDRPWIRRIIILTTIFALILLTITMALLFSAKVDTLVGGAAAAAIGAGMCSILFSVALGIGCVCAYFDRKWIDYCKRFNTRSQVLYWSGIFLGIFSFAEIFLFAGGFANLGFAGFDILQTAAVNAMIPTVVYVAASFLLVAGVMTLIFALKARDLSINAVKSNTTQSAQVSSSNLRNDDSGRLDGVYYDMALAAQKHQEQSRREGLFSKVSEGRSKTPGGDNNEEKALDKPRVEKRSTI